MKTWQRKQKFCFLCKKENKRSFVLCAFSTILGPFVNCARIVQRTNAPNNHGWWNWNSPVFGNSMNYQSQNRTFNRFEINPSISHTQNVIYLGPQGHRLIHHQHPTLYHLDRGHQHGVHGHQVAWMDHVHRPRACHEKRIDMINVFIYIRD